LISDVSQREIKVLISDLRECVEVSTGLKFGDYVLHDLVQLDLNTVGILTRIEHDTAQVIDQNDQVKTVKAQGIRKKIDSRRAVGRDADGNVGAGDTVLVLKGTYEGEKGTVKHIYRASLFLLVRTRISKWRNHRYAYQIMSLKRKSKKSQPFPRLTQDPFTDNEKDIMTSYFTKTYLSLEDNGRAI